jgi:hypothetical protein
LYLYQGRPHQTNLTSGKRIGGTVNKLSQSLIIRGASYYGRWIKRTLDKLSLR